MTIPVGLILVVVMALEASGVDYIPLSRETIVEIRKLLNDNGYPEMANELAVHLDLAEGADDGEITDNG